MSSSAVASKIRRTRRLMLIAGLSVIERDACTIQVGVDAPLRVLIGDAPPGTAQLLNALNGERTIGDLTRCYGDRHGVPYASWDRLLTELVDQGFVVERSPIGTQGQHEWTGQAPDRTALTMEFEGSRAEPGMSRRRDAVVVIVGAGRVAGSLATLLAAAGVGHVHLDPHRAVRASDAAPAGLTMDQVLELAAVPEAVDRSTIAVRAAQTADNSRQSSRVRRVRGAHVTRDPRPAEPRRVDRDELAALIRRVSPAANVHAPGGYVPPEHRGPRHRRSPGSRPGPWAGRRSGTAPGGPGQRTPGRRRASGTAGPVVMPALPRPASTRPRPELAEGAARHGRSHPGATRGAGDVRRRGRRRTGSRFPRRPAHPGFGGRNAGVDIRRMGHPPPELATSSRLFLSNEREDAPTWGQWQV